MVCQYLAINSAASRAALTALHSMSLASKTYNQIATPYLYRHIDTMMCDVQRLLQRTTSENSAPLHLIESLDCSRWQPRRVPSNSSLFFPGNLRGFPGWEDIESTRISGELMVALLKNLVNLKELTLDPATIQSALLHIYALAPETLPDLRRLTIRCRQGVFLCDFTNLLSNRNRAIEDLTVRVCGEVYCTTPLAYRSFLIKNIDICCESMTTRYLTQFLGNCPNLISCRITFEGQVIEYPWEVNILARPAITALRHSRKTLQTLQLLDKRRMTQHAYQHPGSWQGTMQGLYEFIALEDLYTNWYSLNFCDDRIFPESMRSIKIYCCNGFQAPDLEVLLEGGCQAWPKWLALSVEQGEESEGEIVAL